MVKCMSEAIKNSPYLTGAWKQGLKEGRKQGALGEVVLMKLCIQNEGSWKGIQEHIEKRLKQLVKDKGCEKQ